MQLYLSPVVSNREIKKTHMRGRLGAALHDNWSDWGRASWDEHRAERNPYHSHPQLTALHMNTPPTHAIKQSNSEHERIVVSLTLYKCINIVRIN